MALSNRAQRSLALGSPLSDKFSKLFANQYCPDKNPSGLVNVGVAENSLMLGELDGFYHANFRLDDLDYSYGTAMHGSRRLFKALCHFFNAYFSPILPVEEQHLICGAGLAALMDQLVYVFCDEGDGVLLAKPFYSGFKNSIESRCLAKAIGVDVPSDLVTAPESLKYFEKTMNQARSQGIKVTSVMLCNPHNPLGILYPRETILEYCRFAEKHDLHLIVDEIYALSVFRNEDIPREIPFTSILSIDTLAEAGCDPSRVHMIYGASKDFCSNGFRLGFLVSQHNSIIKRSLRNTAIFMKVSSPCDQLFSRLLEAEEFLPSFIKENQNRLGESYKFVTAWCKKHEIEFVPAQAGHFIFINLGRFTKYCSADDESNSTSTNGDKIAAIKNKECDDGKVTSVAEAKLLVDFLDAGVYIGPGAAYEAMESGWFRLTHSVKRPLMELGLKRMERVLGLDGQRRTRMSQQMDKNGANEIAEAIKQLAVCGVCC